MKKLATFYSLKKECALLTRVAQEGIKAGNDYSGLIKHIYDIKEALTKLQVVARRYRKEEKIDSLKTRGYAEMRYPVDNQSMGFIHTFKDLSSKNYLTTIRVASRAMANKSMKIHRQTGAECAKRYYSLFRAIDQQIHRLDTTLGKKVYKLAYAQEIRREERTRGVATQPVFHKYKEVGYVKSNGKVKKYKDWRYEDWKEYREGRRHKTQYWKLG